VHSRTIECEAPHYSPWGGVVQNIEIAPGFWRVVGEYDGGYYLSRTMNALVPAAARGATFQARGFSGWYGGPVETAIIALCFPHYFAPDVVALSRAIIRAERPYLAHQLVATGHLPREG
jgi:hypothetical protein